VHLFPFKLFTRYLVSTKKRDTSETEIVSLEGAILNNLSIDWESSEKKP